VNLNAIAPRTPAPVLRALDRARGAAWPYCVVAFHRIATPAREDDDLSYPAAALDALCRYWRDHFEVLSLDCLLARLAHGDAADRPCLSITFDDGYADNAEIAAPVLDRLELSATFFLCTGAVGAANHFAWDAGLAPRPRLMSWDQARELHRAGFGIGSHTVSHARLSSVRGAALAEELQASRRRLEAELGEATADLAYPFGGLDDCDDIARTAARVAGYRSCFSCHGGLIAAGDSLYRLNRIAISARYHPTPQAWARAYTRARWRTSARRIAADHW
jgi:peptidoglycan/xylan/chitin deacetylase (PgdA/CDA1 family)